MSQPAIQIENLAKTYKGKKRLLVEALKGITFSVQKGEIFGFVGPNGAGKSTTIKILLDLIQASSGDSCINGVKTIDPESRKCVGYLPENPAFYDFLTAREYLLFVAQTFRMESGLAERRADEALKRLELWDARNRPIRGYSKGMTQRVGLAQTLVHDPDVYILDEPMSGLDPLGRVLVKEIILELKEMGKCVFFSTHIIADVESVCDRVGVLLGGELKAVEHVDSFLRDGITGYRVRVASSGGAVREFNVEPEGLAGALSRSVEKGEQVLLVEPERKTLEEYFLEIISRRESV